MRMNKRTVLAVAVSALVASSMVVTGSALALNEDSQLEESVEVVDVEQTDPDETEQDQTEAVTESSPVKETHNTANDVIGDLTIFSTTDVHGHVFNWDYFEDRVPAKEEDQWGMARLASAFESARDEEDAEEDSILLLDNGDAIQGTQLTHLAATHPELLVSQIHPMAETFNALEYDVLNLGNHEFNFGLDLLASYKNELDAPLLGANVKTLVDGQISFEPYKIVDKVIGGETVKVGVLGLVTPGVRIWDKRFVENILEFEDMVVAARRNVPKMKAEGAEIIVVLAHTGENPEGVEWDPEELQENVATSLSTLVPDVDVVIGGHSHVDIPVKVHKDPNGKPVLYTQPYFWARSTSQVDLPIISDSEGNHEIAWPSTESEIMNLVQSHYAKDLTESALITEHPTLPGDHQATIDYVNSVIARNKQKMETVRSRFEDTPALDLIGYVMETRVREALVGTEYEGIPTLGLTSPFTRTCVLPKGDLRVRDIGGLYVYENNTLVASLMTGKQVKEHLEWSARYYVQATKDNPWNEDTHTNAFYEGETRPIPDYNLDIFTGAIEYKVDVTKPVGQRITLKNLDGTAVKDDQQFILASTQYRAAGGGDYPQQNVIWDQGLEIRQLIVDFAAEQTVLDKTQFYVKNWELITDHGKPSPKPVDPDPLDPTDDPDDPYNRSSFNDRDSLRNRLSTDRLAKTGSDVLPLTVAGMILMTLGAAASVTSRRKLKIYKD